MECNHRSTEEEQPHKWLLQLEREVWPLNARARKHQDHSMRQERARALALRLQGDWGCVSQGLDTPKWRGTRTGANMASQDGRGVRNCSRKLARAEFYSTRWHRRNTGNRGPRNQVVNHEELEKALKELGI